METGTTKRKRAASPDDALPQYGVIPYRFAKDAPDRIEIMLITSRNTGRWIVPKGWPIEGEVARAIASIEALEEAGLEGTVGRQPIGFFHYLKGLKRGTNVRCRVEVFAFLAKRQRKTWPEKDERETSWFTPERAIELVREPELKQLIAIFVRRLREHAKD